VGSIQFQCKKEQIKVTLPDQTFVISLMANAQDAEPMWKVNEIKFSSLEDAIAWIKVKSNMTG
jgi:hypothetical protein